MRSGHFRLVTLGRLALERPDGDADAVLAGLNARRRKVALLAVLSLARHGVARDTLVEMFWGDQEEARARHSLSDAVSHLRRVLGRASIVATRSAIALAPSAPLVVDAVELAAAADVFGRRGDDDSVALDERMLALYEGPFLCGIHVEGSATFEHWVARERARLERVFVRAAAVRCRALAGAGRWDACQEVAEQWLEAEPLSGEAAVAYLESLTAGGEGEGRVLAEYDRLRARLRREYELEPDPAVSAVAARIEVRRRERAVVAVVRPELTSVPAGGPPPTSQADASYANARRRRPHRPRRLQWVRLFLPRQPVRSDSSQTSMTSARSARWPAR